MLSIGLTGSIASGKSTVANMLKKLGAELIDADDIAHQIINPLTECGKMVIKEFGQKIQDNHGNIDRKELGKIVFANKERLSMLNKITHPYIMQALKKRLLFYSIKKTSSIVIVDAALLLEKNLKSQFDKIIVVYINEKTQLNRLIKRDKVKREIALKKIQSQMPVREKLKYADFIISNEGPLEETWNTVKKVYTELKELNKKI
ncbi:MAG: dephospho-CoA kinase [Thermodesulfobacteriota bacterium]|nr:dephospho-CoA kinase [Thermodesulfobacteriota bacterium]